MYAVIEAGGQQHLVEPGRYITLNKLPVEVDGEVVFDRVLLVRPDDGEIVVGTPTVADAVVTGSVRRQFRGKKIHGFKYKPKKGYSRRWGARADLTQVTIDQITVAGRVYTAAEGVEPTPMPAAEEQLDEVLGAEEPLEELEDELAAEPLEAIDEFEDELDEDEEE